jgi:dTDP-4-dehydrorhamnose 3,5-epimerase
MIFKKLKLEGSYLIKLDPMQDNRGFFSRVFCENEFKENGLNSNWVQINNSYNKFKGTLRGMHMQNEPFDEVKLVRCIKGEIYDVIVDLRIKSKTFGKWVGQKLSETNREMMYVPSGFAHGFISLTDDSEIMYFSSNFYNGNYERSLNYADKNVGINWPTEIVHVSEKDQIAQNINTFKI